MLPVSNACITSMQSPLKIMLRGALAVVVMALSFVLEVSAAKAASDLLPLGESGGSKGQGRPGRRGITRPARNGGTTWRKAGDTGPDERQRSLDPRVGQSP